MYFCCGTLKKSTKQSNKINRSLKELNSMHENIKFSAVLDSVTGTLISYHCDYEDGMKERVENYLSTIINLKLNAKAITHGLGYDSNKEIIVRGTNSVTILYEFDNSDLLVMFLDLNEISAQVFDSDIFLSTIDNNLSTLYGQLTNKE